MNGPFDDLLEFLGLGDITGIDVVFRRHGDCRDTIVHHLLWIGPVGGVADGVLGRHSRCIDVDLVWILPKASFQMLTIQGILSFIMMFGIFGLATSQADQHNIIAVGVGGVAGVISMWLVGKVFQVMMSLESDGTVRHNDAIGAKGNRLQNDSCWQIRSNSSGIPRRPSDL